uniref:Uncharacterized protein n=1 Tax=Romanomermis culicivorax TaxID=13658 RepID=A0A915JFX6_ROMCU
MPFSILSFQMNKALEENLHQRIEETINVTNDQQIKIIIERLVKDSKENSQTFHYYCLLFTDPSMAKLVVLTLEKIKCNMIYQKIG